MFIIIYSSCMLTLKNPSVPFKPHGGGQGCVPRSSSMSLWIEGLEKEHLDLRGYLDFLFSIKITIKILILGANKSKKDNFIAVFIAGICWMNLTKHVLLYHPAWSPCLLFYSVGDDCKPAIVDFLFRQCLTFWIQCNLDQ